MMDALVFEKEPKAEAKKYALERAVDLLVGRMRLRTPLGAVEFLEFRNRKKPGFLKSWAERLEIARVVSELYRDLFPHEYATSQTPAYSTLREQEFYKLVDEHVFPLMLEHFDEYKNEPNFYLPFIPVRGIQEHDWVQGCCEFEDLQTIFQLALVLSGRSEPEHWNALGLAKRPDPIVGADPNKWDVFVAMCAKMEGTPLLNFTLTFYLLNYNTQCVWLDLPPFAGYIAFEWSREEFGKLIIEKQRADEINHKLAELNAWLDEDRLVRIRCIAELWEMAAVYKETKYGQTTGIEQGTAQA